MGSRQQDLEKRIRIHDRRLQKLKDQQAVYGISADPRIAIEIEDIEEKKRKLVAKLQQLTGKSISNKSSAVNNWNNLMKIGIENFESFNLQDALAYFKEARELSRTINDRKKESSALTYMGHACIRLKIEYKYTSKEDEIHDPLDYYENAARIARQIGCHKEEGWLYLDMGSANHSLIAYDDHPRYDEVLRCYKRALAISRTINDRLLEACALNDMGNIYALLKNYPQTEVLLESAIEILRELVGSPHLSPSERKLRGSLEKRAKSLLAYVRK